MRIAYFSAGTVGAGDLLHSLSIERGLRRVPFAGEYRAFGPPSPFTFARGASYEPVPVHMTELAAPDRADGSRLAKNLREYAPVIALPKPGETPPLHAGKLHSFRVTDQWVDERRIYEQQERVAWEPPTGAG